MRTCVAAILVGIFVGYSPAGYCDPPDGFKSLFNGKDLDHWKIPEGDGGHWRVLGGVVDYDARSEASGGNHGRSLWSKRSFRDFVLQVDWRLKTGEGLRHRVPMIRADGNYQLDDNGQIVEVTIDDLDSGIYLRGSSKAQVNIWCWPIGSGEIWGYRTDASLDADVRSACTPSERADKPRGQWNTFEIKLVDKRLWVKLNGKLVIDAAHLPNLPDNGQIALQHHGSLGRDGRWHASYGRKRWSGTPSLIQFRNIYIKELDEDGN